MKIVLPDSLTTIETLAFEGVEKSRYMVIPDTVNTIGDNFLTKIPVLCGMNSIAWKYAVNHEIEYICTH